MATAILGVWLIHALLRLALGADAKLYGTIPFEYFADTGDALIILRLENREGVLA